MKRRPNRFGISSRLILTVSALIVFACLTVTIFFLHHEKRLIREVLECQGTDLASDLAREVQMPATASHPELLGATLDRFMEREQLAFCAIKDSQGRTLAESKVATRPGDTEEVMVFSYPISGLGTEGSKTGGGKRTAWVGLFPSPWTTRISSLKRAVTGLTIALVVVGVLITLLVVHVTIKPLRMLLAASQRIARGELADPVRVASGGEVGALSDAFTDMAFRLRQSRSQLEEYSRTLERKVEQRTRELKTRVKELSDSRMATINILEDVKEAKTELERVNEELLALDEAKSKFIGTISHELKTPFTAIKSNIDFILSGREGTVPENLRPYLQTVQRNTNRVRKIMDDFLNAVEIRSGRAPLEPEVLRLERVVGEYLAEMGPVDEAFRVTVDIPKDLVVFADRNRLHDVYMNLISNAFKFSPQGGEIRISARTHDGKVLSEVSDQGVGIPPDKWENIFDEFFQVDRKKYGGTGLGLSIVRGIIHQHGGRIWVDSQPGRGSTFFFTLPAHKDSKDEEAGKPTEGPDR